MQGVPSAYVPNSWERNSVKFMGLRYGSRFSQANTTRVQRSNEWVGGRPRRFGLSMLASIWGVFEIPDSCRLSWGWTSSYPSSERKYPVCLMDRWIRQRLILRCRMKRSRLQPARIPTVINVRMSMDMSAAATSASPSPNLVWTRWKIQRIEPNNSPPHVNRIRYNAVRNFGWIWLRLVYLAIRLKFYWRSPKKWMWNNLQSPNCDFMNSPKPMVVSNPSYVRKESHCHPRYNYFWENCFMKAWLTTMMLRA